MDSYELYLFYHLNNSAFMENLDLSGTENETLDCLLHLVLNSKIKSNDENKIFSKCFHSMQDDKIHNSKLDSIFAKLLNGDRCQDLELWVHGKLNSECDLNVLKVLKILVEKLVLNVDDSSTFLKDITKRLIDMLFSYERRLSNSSIIIGILYSTLGHAMMRSWIVNLILLKCEVRGNDYVSSENMSLFCELIISWSKENHICQPDFLLTCFKYFENDLTVKHGIFLLKTLINQNMFEPNDAKSFEKFIIVENSLACKQSHLILPTLDLLKSLNFSFKYHEFWFVLCTYVLSHENTKVKKWGNYIYYFIIICYLHIFSLHLQDCNMF